MANRSRKEELSQYLMAHPDHLPAWAQKFGIEKLPHVVLHLLFAQLPAPSQARYRAQFHVNNSDTLPHIMEGRAPRTGY